MTYDELVTAVQDYCENTFPVVPMNTMIRQAEQTIYNTVQIANLRKNVTGTLSANNKYLSCPNDFLSTYSIAVIDADGEYHYLLNKDVNFIREAYPKATSVGLPKHYGIFGPTTAGSNPPTLTNELSFILGPTPDLAYDVELHYYFYPTSIVQGQLATITLTSGGSGYTSGTYFNVPLIGGSGAPASATVVVTGGSVSSISVNSSTGSGYAVSDPITISASDVGGAGSGAAGVVNEVTNVDGTSWLGDNFDIALFNGTMVEAIRYMKGEQDMVKFYQDQFVQSIALLKNLGDGKQRMDAYRDGQVRNPVK